MRIRIIRILLAQPQRYRLPAGTVSSKRWVRRFPLKLLRSAILQEAHLYLPLLGLGLGLGLGGNRITGSALCIALHKADERTLQTSCWSEYREASHERSTTSNYKVRTNFRFNARKHACRMGIIGVLISQAFHTIQIIWHDAEKRVPQRNLEYLE